MAEPDAREIELPLEGAGARLRNARKAAGLSRRDIAVRTRIAERHLAAIEEGRFADLASRTYAVGFSRAYAREVGLDESEIVAAVREELAAIDALQAPPKPAAFEPGDPARVPAAGLALVAGLAAVGVLVLVFVAWRSYFVPAVPLPDLTTAEQAQAPAPPPAGGTPAPLPQPPARTDGAVVFTALESGVWVKFYDASGQQLMQKQMALGESYTVPPEADGPRIWTGRPDALKVTVGGKPVAPLADRQRIVKDVPVSAAALLARGEEDSASPEVQAAPDTTSRPLTARPEMLTRAMPEAAEAAEAVDQDDPAQDDATAPRSRPALAAQEAVRGREGSTVSE